MGNVVFKRFLVLMSSLSSKAAFVAFVLRRNQPDSTAYTVAPTMQPLKADICTDVEESRSQLLRRTALLRLLRLLHLLRLLRLCRDLH